MVGHGQYVVVNHGAVVVGRGPDVGAGGVLVVQGQYVVWFDGVLVVQGQYVVGFGGVLVVQGQCAVVVS